MQYEIYTFFCNCTTPEHDSFQLIFLAFICPPTSHATTNTQHKTYSEYVKAQKKVFADCYNPILMAYTLTTLLYTTEATKTVLREERMDKLILHHKMLWNEWAKWQMYLNI